MGRSSRSGLMQRNLQRHMCIAVAICTALAVLSGGCGRDRPDAAADEKMMTLSFGDASLGSALVMARGEVGARHMVVTLILVQPDPPNAKRVQCDVDRLVVYVADAAGKPRAYPAATTVVGETSLHQQRQYLAEMRLDYVFSTKDQLIVRCGGRTAALPFAVAVAQHVEKEAEIRGRGYGRR